MNSGGVKIGDSQQGKVSMVVPCYNKEKYIGAMLDSVLAQKLDNIELLPINDGSTDGTRIRSYTLEVEKRDLINQISKSDNIHIDVAEFFDRGYDIVFSGIERRYLKNEKVFKRNIGYVELEKSVLNILPRLVGSQYCPNELWDRSGDGLRVKLSDFDSLAADDLIIDFPMKKMVVSELAEILHDCPATVYLKM